MSHERERVGAEEGIEQQLDADSPASAQRKEEKWKLSGKGKGNRWLMLRDLCAIISLRPMGMTLIQDTMFLHRGLKRATVREMVDQLERTKSIEQVKDIVSENMPFWVWVATAGGVQFWIGSRNRIPASIAKVAWTLTVVAISGGIAE
jgi:hypothetical protein